VDIDALVDALKSRHLAVAGMDVFPVELKHKLEEVPGTIRTRILY
jgi:phosphoglycerate dehydrogenase-like enzyme